MPEISVIIPLYNAEMFIAEALVSLTQQTFQNYEIIIIDDGSTDNSANIVKTYKNLHYYYQNNQGEASARNKGIEFAQGKIITFLDADDWYEPTKLEEQWIYLQQNPNIDVVYCDYNVKDQTNGTTSTLQSEFFDSNRKNLLAMILFRQTVHTGSMMLRRQVFDFGYRYNQQLSYAPDYDFCLQLLAQHQFGYIAKPLYGYRRHGANMTNAHNQQKASEAAIVRALGFKKIKQIIAESSFENTEKNLLLARIFLKTGYYRECLQQLEKTISEEHQALAFFYRGNCQYLLGNLSLSQQAYQTAIDLYPNFSEALNNLGCTLLASNENEDAKQAFTTSLNLRPGYMDAVKNLAGGHPPQLTLFELRNVLTRYY